MAGRLRSFLAVPDSVIPVASGVDLLRRLDAAFFRVGAAREGVLVEYHAGEPQASEEVQETLSGTVWLTGRGLTLSRVTPLPMG